MINLYPYQNEAVKKLREKIRQGKTKLVLCSPTGSGKTFVFTYMTYRAINKGKKVLIITDRIELLKQAGGSLNHFNLKPIEIKPSNKFKKLNGVIYSAMAQTLIRRIKKPLYQKWIKDLDLIILDEAHKQSFNFLFEHISKKTIVIGATATPYRESNQESMDSFYNDIVEVISISDLIKNGFLSKPKSYGVPIDLSNIKTKGSDYDNKQMGDEYNEQKLYHGVYENYTKITPGQKAIIFSPSVESSITLVQSFKSKGLPIEHIDANTKKSERNKILNWFKNTKNAMISNVGILNAGFDCPDIKVVILYRATKSLPLFLQMVGRGSRITDTKKEFTILDFGNNIKTHGFWEEDRVWSLKKKKKKKEGEAPVKECPSCMAVVYASVMECPECGHVFEKKIDKDEFIIVELQQMSYKNLKKEIANADFKKLNQIQKAKGYKKSWIYHQLKTKEDFHSYAKFMNYKPGWANYQIKNRNI
jgi:superfamily II DNA or RNA helicase